MDYIMKNAEAMDLAEKAIALREHGDKKQALPLFRQAFEWEKEVALATLQADADETTIAVALQSASALALDAEKYREAEPIGPPGTFEKSPGGNRAGIAGNSP